MDRRRLIKRGAAAALALPPVIESMAIPAAAATADFPASYIAPGT